MSWRVVDTGRGDAATNMAVDEAIMLAHGRGDAPATLRFYGWRPMAVSLGYFQRAGGEVDLAACAQLGVDVVRRLTGGRAVLHDAELTYSIVVREDCQSIPPTITASYLYFSRGLLAGLTALGIRAELSVPREAYGARGGQRRKPQSAACFDASAQYEVNYGGRKLVGSAQVRKHGVILQHGSLLLRFSPDLLSRVLICRSPEARQTLAQTLAAGVVSVEEILGRSVGWGEICGAVRTGFESALGIGLEPGELTAGEKETARQLAETKYGSAGWNFKR